MGKKLDYDALRKKDLLAYAGAKTNVDYHVPWRADKTPSLRFFRSKEEGVILFKDMAGGSEQNCGTIIDFVRQINHFENDKYGRYKAAQIVDKWQQGQEVQLDSTPGKSKGRADEAPEITDERKEARYKKTRLAIDTANNSSYLKEHGMTMQPWMQQSLQAYTDSRGNLAWFNEAGDIAVKGRRQSHNGKTYHDIASSQPYVDAINTISIAGKRDSKDVVVVEGLGDALAHAHMFKKNPEERCYIILNGSGNANSAIDYIKSNNGNDAKVNLWLDTDDGGTKATAQIIEAIPHAVNNTPRIEEYNKKHGTDCKDLGDIYQAEKNKHNDKTDDNTKTPAKARDEIQIER